MSINIKNKKLVGTIGTTILVIGLGVTWAFGNVNKAENAETTLLSSDRYIKHQMVEINNIISKSKEDLVKNEDAKTLLEEIENDSNKLKSKDADKRDDSIGSKNADFSKSVSEIKSNIETFKKIEANVDELIAIYDSNEDMQKNEKLSQNMEDMIEENYRIEDYIKEFNKEVKSFNDAISKLPVNLISESRGWETVNSIKSK